MGGGHGPPRALTPPWSRLCSDDQHNFIIPSPLGEMLFFQEYFSGILERFENNQTLEILANKEKKSLLPSALHRSALHECHMQSKDQLTTITCEYIFYIERIIKH